MDFRPTQQKKQTHLKTRDSLWDKILRVAELQNYLQGDAHGGNSFLGLPLCLVNKANLLKRSLQAQKPKQRDLMFFGAINYGERFSLYL
jgi:hypothetical protein